MKKDRKRTPVEGMQIIARLLTERDGSEKSSKAFDNTDVQGDTTMPTQVPNHEQHWPEHLLPHRIEEYVRSDGQPPTQNRAFAKRVTGNQVLESIVRAQASLKLTAIDPRYFVGTCFHEAGCVNEWDTEIASPTCIKGFVSVGAFQIGEEEARRYGFQLADMLDLDKSSICMVRMAEDNRKAIRSAALLAPNAPDPDYTDSNGFVWSGGTLRAYLGIAHNKGNGFTRTTIRNHGLDWAGYQKRNPTDRIVSNRYGQDCITGGPQWPSKAPTEPVPHAPSDRILELTQPLMTGEDVAELQRHLKLKDDGTFGPKTKAAVIEFQETHGLKSDGQVGQKTWVVLLATD